MKKPAKNEPKLLAVAVADLHLSSKPPAFRSNEPDWLHTQASYLDQLRHLVTSPLGEQKLPVLCAGDVFDRWNSSPDVVNIALAHLPHMHAVYGNHDLPNHNAGELRRSAWWTLVKAGKVTPLMPGEPVEITGAVPLRVHGFPYNSKVKPLRDPHDLALEVAVVHAFIYTRKTGYDGAPKEQHVYQWEHLLKGYDVALFGDNHRPFSYRQKGNDEAGLVFNCGSFMRRKSDEQEYRPSVGLIFSDGTVKRHYLNVSSDQTMQGDALAKVVNGIGFETFLESLAELGDSALNFADAVRKTLDRKKVPDAVRRIILNTLDKE